MSKQKVIEINSNPPKFEKIKRLKKKVDLTPVEITEPVPCVGGVK